jgi:pimeloyl-ACP methyl ester carboxylesterase
MKSMLQRSTRLTIIVPVTFFFLATLMACNQKEVRRDENNSLIKETLSSEGVKIEYRVNGQKNDTVLVFIHEWLCNQTYWKNQVQYFSGKHRVVTLDLAGHGLSGDNRTAYTFDLYADDVIAVIDKIKARKVILVGHSMGASVAVKVALRMPDKVVAIIAVDAFQNLTQDYPEGNIDKMMEPYRKDIRTAVRKHASILFGESPDSLLVRKVLNDWSSADPVMAKATMIENLHFKPSVWTKALTVPVYAVNAERFPANVIGNKEMLKNYQIITLPRVGHFPQLEDPQGFNRAVSTYLAKISNDS